MFAAPYIALTDQAWFDFLATRAVDGRVDEVNFWSPSSLQPLRRMTSGEPVFFRSKSPRNAISGYGFFAHFAVLGLEQAWDTFGWKNGDPDALRFLQRIGRYRRLDLLAPGAERAPLGCTILRDAVFWPPERCLAWSEAKGWHANIVRGKSETDPARASELLAEIQFDHLEAPAEFVPVFEPLEADQRELVLARSMERVGQGAFRSRLLDAYGRRCAITGERTEPVLDAAHVQPYLGAASNHVQNGLLLTKEFHKLFDAGLVTVTPEYRVRVSPRIRERWSNGRRFYAHDERELTQLPTRDSDLPSRLALRWHDEHVFER